MKPKIILIKVYVFNTQLVFDLSDRRSLFSSQNFSCKETKNDENFVVVKRNIFKFESGADTERIRNIDSCRVQSVEVMSPYR